MDALIDYSVVADCRTNFNGYVFCKCDIAADIDTIADYAIFIDRRIISYRHAITNIYILVENHKLANLRVVTNGHALPDYCTGSNDRVHAY